MREYRGRKDNGEWVYGSLLGSDIIVAAGSVDVDEDYIRIGEWCSVDSDTVGQWTGIKDRKGYKLFEGDIVQIIDLGFEKVDDIESFDEWLENEKVISHSIDEEGFISYQYVKKTDVVVMDRFPHFWLGDEGFGYEGEDLVYPESCELIGNIHDHHHLLKGQ